MHRLSSSSFLYSGESVLAVFWILQSVSSQWFPTATKGWPTMATLLQEKYEARKAEVNERFEQLRANEEELNRIFAKIYNMEGEVPIEVEDKYV